MLWCPLRFPLDMKKPEWTQTRETRYHALFTKQCLGQQLSKQESDRLKSLAEFRVRCLPMSDAEIERMERSKAKTLKLIKALQTLISGAGPSADLPGSKSEYRAGNSPDLSSRLARNW